MVLGPVQFKICRRWGSLTLHPKSVHNYHIRKTKAIIIIIIIIDINREIQELEQEKTYKYLGIEKSEGMQHQQMKERLKQEYSKRLRMILTSELNARNNVTAIGALAVPVLRYSFGIINGELKK